MHVCCCLWLVHLKVAAPPVSGSHPVGHTASDGRALVTECASYTVGRVLSLVRHNASADKVLPTVSSRCRSFAQPAASCNPQVLHFQLRSLPTSSFSAPSLHPVGFRHRFPLRLKTVMVSGVVGEDRVPRRLIAVCWEVDSPAGEVDVGLAT